MTTWSEIHQGYADAFSSVMAGDDTVPLVYPYTPPSINPPCIFPGEAGWKPEGQGGVRLGTINWHVAVPATVDAWMSLLDDLIEGENGMLAVLEDDPTLGGLDLNVVWTAVTKYGVLEFAGTSYWGAQVATEVRY